MSVKVNAPIKLQVSSGSWTGVVRRIGSRLDLLVETSGLLKVGEKGSFEIEIPGHSAVVDGTLRVRNAGERTGPYTRYILHITQATARNRQVLTAWMRGQLGSRHPHHSSPVERRPAAAAAARAPQALRYPKGTIEVGAPLAMRTDSGVREGTLVRFHGTEFLVEVTQPITVGGQAFFQFEVPSYGIEVYGTAKVQLEAWSDAGSHGYVLVMHLMRRADRDLLLEWLHDQVEDRGGEDDSSGPALSDMPTNIPSSLPPAQVQALATSSSRGRGKPGTRSGASEASDIRAREPVSGRDSIREVLRRRFFGGSRK
jgi:hypothetical protein